MAIDAGKTPLIVDSDPRLSRVWKSDTLGSKEISESFPFSQAVGFQSNASANVLGLDANRPQLSDIILKGFETYTTGAGIQKVKAKFRIYNSSKQKIDGYQYVLTISDKQGGRA